MANPSDVSQLNAILERVASIQLTVAITVPSGFTSAGSVSAAYPYPVNDPSMANLPFFYNAYKGGPVKFQALKGYLTTSDIEMTLCIENFTSEMSIDRVYTLVALWRDAVLATFAGKVRLGGDLSYIMDAAVTHVSEFKRVSTEGSAEYGALVFTLQVRELYPVAIGL